MKIDPQNPTNEELALLNDLMKQADKQPRKRVSKNINLDGTPYKDRPAYLSNNHQAQLPFSLVKFGDEYWVIEKQLGTGSTAKVKTLPISYKQDESGNYQKIEHPSKSVIKTIKMDEKIKRIIVDSYNEKGINISSADDDVWPYFLKMAKHQLAILKKSGDTTAALVIDEKEKKIHIKSEEAKKLPLHKYLFTHQELSFSQRLHLFNLVKDAVNQLHKKEIGHLDLKLENIFYDEESDKIKLIDFGSAQLVNQKLADVPQHLHSTTSFFDPRENYKDKISHEERLDHNQNTPKQIDHYSLAGVGGLIFSAWQNVESEKGWETLPLFNNKNQGMSKCFPYAFDELKKVNYLQPGEEGEMAKVIAALNILGNEDKTKRNPEEFEQQMQKVNGYEEDIKLIAAQRKFEGKLAAALEKLHEVKSEPAKVLFSQLEILNNQISDYENLLQEKFNYEDLSNNEKTKLTKEINILNNMSTDLNNLVSAIAQAPTLPTQKESELTQSQKELLTQTQDFETKWKGRSLWKKYPTLTCVVVSCVGVVLGAVVGAIVGAAAFSWTGPGAIVAGVVGAMIGAFAGGTLGFAATGGTSLLADDWMRKRINRGYSSIFTPYAVEKLERSDKIKKAISNYEVSLNEVMSTVKSFKR